MDYYRNVKIEADETESANKEEEIEDTQSYLEAMSQMVGLRPTAPIAEVEEEADFVDEAYEDEILPEVTDELVEEPAFADDDDDF